MKSEIKNTIIEKMIMLDPKYQFDNRSGRLQSLITDGVEAMEPFSVNYLTSSKDKDINFGVMLEQYYINTKTKLI